MLNSYIQTRLQKWLKQRIPPAKQHVLSSQNIFIFPSFFGFAYLFMVLIIFLLGTNYQNNIILIFSFLLASLFVTAMLFSFQNLNHIEVKLLNEPQGFANKLSYLKLDVSSLKQHHNLFLYVEPESDQGVLIDITKAQGDTAHLVPVQHGQRGVQTLGRLRVESNFPLGLFKTWTRLDMASQLITFPEPKLPAQTPQARRVLEGEHDGHNVAIEQSGDFYQLESYQPGQPLSKVAWKHLAKTQQWLSRSHASATIDDLWLDYEQMPSSLLEEKYCQLCALVLEHHTLNQAYGLRLPQKTIEIAHGESHQIACLMALAKA